MAKTGVFDSDPAAKAAELKKELQKLVKAIIDDEDCGGAAIDRAAEALCSLREVKHRKGSSIFPRIGEAVSCPEEFRCPISKELMTDPVVVASGQTYDRVFIQRWLKSGNRTCPRTQQVLTHTILTPNHLIRSLISQWCKTRGLEPSDLVEYAGESDTTGADRSRFLSLLEKMSGDLPEQKSAARELRRLTKKVPAFRALFGESPAAIPKLIGPISGAHRDHNHDLQEDIITTILNLSIHDDNKKLVAETPLVVPLLISALKSGTIETRSNAAAAIFTLSALDSNKALIGKAGALKPLIDLLEEGHESAMKDVASAIFNLCIIHENKSRAVRDGAVRVIVSKIANRVLVDELVAILAMLSGHQRAVQEMGEMCAAPCLLGFIRESACPRNKENCVAILYTLCYYDRSQWKYVKEEENVHGTISDLAKNGTSRAKRKANGVLDRMNRVVNITHTA